MWSKSHDGESVGLVELRQRVGRQGVQLKDTVGRGEVGAGQLGPAAAVEVVDWPGCVGDGVVRVAAADHVAASRLREDTH